MRELFIYYRLRSGDASAAHAIVANFQARLRERYPSVVARLLCRPPDGGDVQTWMETYSTDSLHEPGGVTVELQSEIEERARTLLPVLMGPRHTEVFIACVL